MDTLQTYPSALIEAALTTAIGSLVRVEYVFTSGHLHQFPRKVTNPSIVPGQVVRTTAWLTSVEGRAHSFKTYSFGLGIFTAMSVDTLHIESGPNAEGILPTIRLSSDWLTNSLSVEDSARTLLNF